MGKDDPETVANKLIPEEYRIWSGLVQKVNEKGKADKKPTFLVISAYNLGYLNAKKQKLEPEFLWTNIEAYSFKESEIKLTFRDANPGKSKKKTPCEIRFQAANASEIHMVLYQFLCETLSQGEFDDLNLKEYGTSAVTPSPRRILNRAVMRTAGHQLKDRPGAHLKQIIETMQPRCVFEADDLGNSLDVVMYVMKAFWGLSLELPDVAGAWSEVKKALPLNYEFIETGEELNDDFSSFCEEAKSKGGRLSGLGLRGQALSDDHVNTIVAAAESLRLATLSFTSCGMNCGSFASSIQAKLSYSLEMLVLDSVNDLRIEEVLPKLTFLRALSVRNCGIEIGSLLQRLQDYNYSNLSMLDVSKNSFNSPLVVNDGWPLTRLQRLQMDDVRWQGGAIGPFIRTLFQQRFQNGLKLSLNRAQWSQADADAAISELKMANTSQLVELCWNENLVNREFVAFVAKCINLACLGVRGCFGDDVELLQSFGDAVAGMPMLMELRMSGTAARRVGSSISVFFDAVQNAQRLFVIDVSNQNIGMPGYQSLENLVAQRGNMVVAADESGVDDCSCFERIARRVPMGSMVAFPVNDMARLLEQGTIDNDRYNEVKTLFSNIFARRPVDTKAEPFGYFAFDSHVDEFPVVMNMNVRQQLDQMVEWVPMGEGSGGRGRDSDSGVPKSDSSGASYSRNKGKAGQSDLDGRGKKSKRMGSSDEDGRDKQMRSASKKRVDDYSDDDDRRKARKSAKKRVDDYSDDDDGRKPRKSAKKQIDDSSDDDYRRKPMKGSKKKQIDDYSDDDKRKPLKGSKKKQIDDYSDDDYRRKPTKGSKKKQIDDYSDDDYARKKPTKGSKKKQVDDYSDDDYRKKPMKGSKKQRIDDSSDDDRRKPTKGSKKRIDDYSDDDYARKPQRSSKKKRLDDYSDDDYARKPTKGSKKQIDDSSDDYARKPQKSWKKKRIDDYSDDDYGRKPMKGSKKQRIDDYSDDRDRRTSKRGMSYSSDDEGIYYKPGKRSSKRASVGKKFDDQPRGSIASETTSSKRILQSGRARPKRDQYEVPRWEFPPALAQKFDAKPAFQRLQQEFALSVLRDSI